ncbi:Mu transposase C-terminal domain-containing protein [Microbacterium sp. NPDC090007]|uniref:Mu transposase C-terminal domain-containing protein n=1 Tax=Microbacterium sp. NPDC090007 TaxID=3364204 RepID=UPI0037F23453
MPAHAEDLDALLLTATATKRVQRDGIRFASTRYVSPVLAAYVGEDVTVRYDPRDLGEVRLFHDNALLCRAIAPERSPETITFADLQSARNSRRRALKQQLRSPTNIASSLHSPTPPPSPQSCAPRTGTPVLPIASSRKSDGP